MQRVRLVTTYPCCGGPSIMRATPEVPRETYDRVCPRCGQRWTVRRRSLPVTDRRMARLDALDWERVN